MKTEAELKKLAEFALTYCGFKKNGTAWLRKQCVHAPALAISTKYIEVDVFHAGGSLSCVTAVILAHLALREMEKRGFQYEMTTIWNFDSGNLEYQYQFYDGNIQSNKEDKNEYIALWSAIMEAVGEK